MEMISKLAKTINSEEATPESIIEKLCEICVAIRYEKAICKLHQEDLPTLKECKCVICYPPPKTENE